MTCSESRTFSFQLCRNTVSLMSICLMTPCLRSCSGSCLLVRVCSQSQCGNNYGRLLPTMEDPRSPTARPSPTLWQSSELQNPKLSPMSWSPPVPQTFPLPGTPDHRICRLVSLHALCAGVLVLLQWYCYRHRFWKVRNSAVLQLPTSFDQYDNMNNRHISFMHYAQ